MDLESYRFKIETFECIAIPDGTLVSTAEFAFANAQRDFLKQALRRHHLQSHVMLVPVTCLLVDTGRHKVLLDTGFGAGFDPAVGKLVHNLQTEGIEPQDVDMVVLSHGHLDHIGGNTDEQGRPAFPNARYLISKDEWDFWTSETNLANVDESLAAFARRNLPPIKERVELIEGEGEILPGFQILSAPGHTVGHIAVLVSSGNKSLLSIGDAAGHPIHLEHPKWYIASDASPQEALLSRQRLLDLAATDSTVLFGYHFPFPGLGRVIKKGKGWGWQPHESSLP